MNTYIIKYFGGKKEEINCGNIGHVITILKRRSVDIDFIESIELKK